MKLIAVALAVLVGCVGTTDGDNEDLGGGDDSTIGDPDTGLTDPGTGLDTSGSDGEGSASNLPEFHGRCGSPSIVRAGARLHAFFPIQGFQGHTVHVAHARSEDDGKTWLRVGDALPQLGPGVKPGSSVWAPAAAKIGNKWVLYYSAVEAGTEQHFCIFRAESDHPGDAFRDRHGSPIVCPGSGHWAIDPYLVQDSDGSWWLEARYDKADHVNTISVRKLDAAGVDFAAGSEWHELTRIGKGGWEEPVMENAALVQLPVPGAAPHWFVFYSGGSYRNNSYAVGYADCGTHITGPCTKKTVAEPWLDNNAGLKMFGPGTPTFWPDAQGAQMMTVNTWKFSGGQDSVDNHGQIMHTFEVHVNANGKPVSTFVRRNE